MFYVFFIKKKARERKKQSEEGKICQRKEKKSRREKDIEKGKEKLETFQRYDKERGYDGKEK